MEGPQRWERQLIGKKRYNRLFRELDTKLRTRELKDLIRDKTGIPTLVEDYELDLDFNLGIYLTEDIVDVMQDVVKTRNDHEKERNRRFNNWAWW